MPPPSSWFPGQEHPSFERFCLFDSFWQKSAYLTLTEALVLQPAGSRDRGTQLSCLGGARITFRAPLTPTLTHGAPAPCPRGSQRPLGPTIRPLQVPTLTRGPYPAMRQAPGSVNPSSVRHAFQNIAGSFPGPCTGRTMPFLPSGLPARGTLLSSVLSHSDPFWTIPAHRVTRTLAETLIRQPAGSPRSRGPTYPACVVPDHIRAHQPDTDSVGSPPPSSSRAATAPFRPATQRSGSVNAPSLGSCKSEHRRVLSGSVH